MTILVPDPGKTEALVRVQARGVCHTDLHYHEGGVSDELPFILGHEAAGIVEAIGRNREVLGANPEWGASPTRAASSRTARHTHRVWSRHLVRRPAHQERITWLGVHRAGVSFDEWACPGEESA